jgi:acyl dehydratase
MSKEWGKVSIDVKPSIDHKVLENYKMEPFPYEYDEKDLIIYSLGIGFGQNDCTSKATLQNTYDSHKDFGMFPSFAVIPPFKCIANVVGLPKLKFNPMMLLHGETEFILHQPSSLVPVEGAMTTYGVVTGVYDKKSGASIEITASTFDTANPKKVYFTNIMTLFIRGLGGFAANGGKTGPDTPPVLDVVAPNGLNPIKSVSYKTSLQQALLYRLSGDTNPLHVDPALAKTGGFNQPILHGLGTLGFSVRGLVHLACGDDRDQVVSVKCRFMKPVFPGQTLKIDVFEEKIVQIPDVLSKFEQNTAKVATRMATYRLVYFKTFVEETGDQVLAAYALLQHQKEAKL